MNYNHLYHAGNFADVFKHCILVLLTQFFCKKDKPFLYLDTHAGTACYDLLAEAAQKTHECEDGIVRLINHVEALPAHDQHTIPLVINMYLDIVRSFNQTENKPEKKNLRYYPGSPLIAHTLLRSQDRMLLFELHRDYVRELKQKLAGDDNRVAVAVHHLDGYQSMKAFLPPPEQRALILIDPPFEEKDEFQRVIETLQVAQQRFPSGVYMVWYPIKDLLSVKNFQWELRKLDCKNVLVAELSVDDVKAGANRAKGVKGRGAAMMAVAGASYNSNRYYRDKDIVEADARQKLTGCGVAIINAPWQFEQQLKPLVSWLGGVLSKRVGSGAESVENIESAESAMNVKTPKNAKSAKNPKGAKSAVVKILVNS